jgi:hypothetical protein
MQPRRLPDVGADCSEVTDIRKPVHAAQAHDRAPYVVYAQQYVTPPLIILEESHPFLGAIGMTVHDMQGADEFHAAARQRCVGATYIGHAEVDDRLGRRAFTFRQHQPDPAAIEKRQRPERIKLFEPQAFSIPPARRLDVLHASADLADGTEGALLSTVTPCLKRLLPCRTPCQSRNSRRLEKPSL